MSLIIILILPLLAGALSGAPLTRKVAASATVISSVVVFALALHAALVVADGKLMVAIPNWVALDGLSALILLLVALVGMAAALFSWGYMSQRAYSQQQMRFYYASYNLFFFSLMAIPILVEPNLVWIAVELSALFSVLLVSFENTHEALEAAWKYIVLMFMGAAIALFGFFVLFWAMQTAGGGTYTWESLRAAAPAMPSVLLMAAFLMIFVGYGIKVGFVPLHTWLPDAHSQAPSPICAMLSGVKTTTALYVILRLLPLLPPQRTGIWMLFFGLLSVGAAAFLLLRVRDYKRLFAFSTVEHMGIILTAAGLGVFAGYYGAIVQIVSHSITKSFCFFASGAVLLAADTREIESVRGLIRTSPVAGIALLLGGLAVAGAPPFAVFLSEFSIFKAGLALGQYMAMTLLALFIAIAFFGILFHINRMVFGQPANNPHPSASLPASCMVTLGVMGLLVIVLGLYLPTPLHELLRLAAASVGGSAP